MAISGGFRRGQNLSINRDSNADNVLDYDSERTRRNAERRKNQKRGIILMILMFLLVLAFLVGAWQLDVILKTSDSNLAAGADDNTSFVDCDITSSSSAKEVKIAGDFATIPDRTQQTICRILENEDILSSNGLAIREISLPAGFARALDMKILGSRANTYRILVDSNVVLQLGALVDAEKILIEKDIHPSLVDLRVEGRALIREG